jgi:hypothetical protein
MAYVSPTQITALLPDSPGSYTTTFNGTVKVVSGGVADVGTLSNTPFTVRILPTAPGFFRVELDCPYPFFRTDAGLFLFSPPPLNPTACGLASMEAGYGVVVRGTVFDQSGLLVTSENPIVVGGVYSAYLTGLGLHLNWTANGPVPTGFVSFQPNVAIANGGLGDGECCIYIGPSNEPGVYRIDFQLPNDLRKVFTNGVSLPNCGSIQSDIGAELELYIYGANASAATDQISIPVFIAKNQLACSP